MELFEDVFETTGIFFFLTDLPSISQSVQGFEGRKDKTYSTVTIQPDFL